MVSYLLRLEPHRESTDGSNKTAQAHLLLCCTGTGRFFQPFFKVQTQCFIESSCTTSFVEPYRCTTVQHCRFDEQIEAKHLVSLGCSLCGGLFITRFSGPLGREKHETMKRRQTHPLLRRRTISMQVRGRKSAPIDRHLHSRKQPRNSTQMLPNPQFLLNFKALSCQKGGKNFKHPCEGRKIFDNRTSCLPACFCMWRYLCLEPVSRLLCVSMRLARAVTSALASPMVVYILRALAIAVSGAFLKLW